ncbi:MAG: helix-turn-helix domain-containing protein [Verrucomicrobiales bacterium]
MQTDPSTQTTSMKLGNSKIFRVYSHAFEGATGLRLSLKSTRGAASASAVPVMLGTGPIAFLHIRPNGERRELSGTRFEAALTLVKTFAIQLGELAGRILLEQQAAEPAAITKAKQYILEKLDEPLKLDEVAAQVRVSPFYFCKLFKSTTGMTFTEFVNRQRIERAKRRLLDPSERITEIAYDIGYQSLSQFNRSFLRIVGESPTQFRKRMGVGKMSHQRVA